MTLMTAAYIAADLTAVSLLVGALYAPRHSRKDLAAAYIGVNVGVLAVTLLLSTANVAAGLGLGLFGVLSIIRLRSTALSQHEVAYFFAALALGLLGGIQTASLAMIVALMALVVASLWLADHPALMRRSRHQVITLDRAFTDETALVAHLEHTLGVTVCSVEVQRLDLVNDTTQVDVRFQLPRETGRAAQHAAGQAASQARTAPAASGHTRRTDPAEGAAATPAPTAPTSTTGATPAAATAQHAVGAGALREPTTTHTTRPYYRAYNVYDSRIPASDTYQQPGHPSSSPAAHERAGSRHTVAAG